MPIYKHYGYWQVSTINILKHDIEHYTCSPTEVGLGLCSQGVYKLLCGLMSSRDYKELIPKAQDGDRG